MKLCHKEAVAIIVLTYAGAALADPLVSTYALVGTQQDQCYDNQGAIDCPHAGKPFHGQDAERPGATASYHDNRDGTILDQVTGLLWTKDIGDKVTWEQARNNAAALRIGGFDDWRLPTVKELYSLMDFRGHSDVDPRHGKPYIDTDYFDFKYGDPAKGGRVTDGQTWSSTRYRMGGGDSAFEVNFADGRMKAYPLFDPNKEEKTPTRLYARYVRGPAYGVNKLEEGIGGVVIDHATGLVWQRSDDGKTRTWQEALAYCEGLYLSGRADWHLPNAKELQSIVDYGRSAIPAAHPYFTVREPKGYFWTSTTHLDGPLQGGAKAAYVAFGKAMGYREVPDSSGEVALADTDGAGAVRSDPKTGEADDFPHGLGSEGDEVRAKNYVRCVSTGE